MTVVRFSVKVVAKAIPSTATAGLLGQHHQLGRVRQVETHRHMAGRHMMEPVGVGRGRHGLQPNANAAAASRGALRRLTACSPIRGLQQQAAGGCQGQQGLENAC